MTPDGLAAELIDELQAHRIAVVELPECDRQPRPRFPRFATWHLTGNETVHTTTGGFIEYEDLQFSRDDARALGLALLAAVNATEAGA